MSYYLAEIVAGHPGMTVVDQLNTLLVQKTITQSQHRTLAQAIDGRARQLLSYQDITQHLEVLLDNGAIVKIPAYQPPEGFARGQQVRVVAKSFATPEEELTWHVDLVRKSDTSLDYGQALDRVVKECPELWSRHIEAQRSGIKTPPSVVKQAALDYQDVLKMADARLAQTPDQSREQVLMALVLEHPDDPAFYAAYRRYHNSGEALRDYHARRIAKLRAAATP